jgi:2-oxoglutarate dehydrogenase E1 component
MSQGPVGTCSNVEALEALYNSWRANPESVDPSWRVFFEGFELGCSKTVPTPQGIPHTEIVRLIYAYRALGHLLANLDPLNEPPTTHPSWSCPSLA